MTKQTYRFDEDSQTFIPLNPDKDSISYAEKLAEEKAKKALEDAKLFRGYL